MPPDGGPAGCDWKSRSRSAARSREAIRRSGWPTLEGACGWTWRALGASLPGARRRAPFEVPNLVANLRRPLVMFLVLRLFHLAAKANQLALLIGATLVSARPLADMLRLAVNICNQGRQLLLEEYVIVRAAEATLISELIEGDTACRAGPLIELRQLL